MAEVKIKLKGIVTNGKRVYDRPEIKQAILAELEGKRFEEIIQKEHVDKTGKQLAYYFGGIIAGTLMKMEMFKGQTKTEIDLDLKRLLRPYQKVFKENGKLIIKEMYDDIAEYNIDEMSLFLEDVLNFLASHDIHPLSPEEYNLKKYISYD